jgi:hypothetical protein
MKNKIILTDIDGVVLDWEESFAIWMDYNGHQLVDDYQYKYDVAKRYGLNKETSNKLVRQFNASAAIGFLPPLRDAQYYMKLLHEKHKYKFIAVTSLSLDPYAQKLRERNLAKLFGDNTFQEVICLDTGADKDDVLIDLSYEYQGCYWIEDKIVNAQLGSDIGYDTFLMEHGHSLKASGEFKVVKNWEMIYNEIVGN